MSHAEGDKVLPVYQQDPIRVLTVHPDERRGPAPVFTFRPYRGVLLLAAALSAGVAVFFHLLSRPNEWVWLFHIIPMPACFLTVACLVAAAGWMGIFFWNLGWGREIVMDRAGLVLPGRGRVAWSQITSVRLISYPCRRFGNVQLTLSDTRRIYIRWTQMGCPAGKFYDALKETYALSLESAEQHSSGSSQPATFADLHVHI